MRRLVTILGGLLVALPAGSGCSSLMPCPQATTGWQFQVGTPAIVHSSALVQQGQGFLAAVPLAAGPVGQLGTADVPARMAAAPEPCGPAPSLLAPRQRLTPDCDLNDVCRRLDTLERRLSLRPEELPAPRKLPAGPPGAE